MASRRKQAKKQQRKAQHKQNKAGLIAGDKINELTEQISVAGTDPQPASNISEEAPVTEPEKELDEHSSEEEDERDEEREFTFIVANDLRKGGFVLLRKEKHPCKVMEMHKSKTGKHGGAKIRVIGIDILSGKKYDDIFLSKEQVEIPIVKKNKFELIKIENGEALLRDLTPDKKTTSTPESKEKRIKIDPDNNEIHAELTEKAKGPRSVQAIVVTAMNADAIAEVRVI